MRKYLPFLLTFLGIAIFCYLTLRTGIEPILSALANVGIRGFLLIVLAQFVMTVFLGVAWKGSTPGIGILRLIMARFVRDAATTCLPFSQLGGMVIGIHATIIGPGDKPGRSSCRHHLPDWPEGIAVNIVDMTAEVLGQIAFVVFALLCLVGHQDAGRFIWPSAIAVVLLSLGVAGFIWTQQHGGNILGKIIRFLTKHITADWSSTLADGADLLQERLESLWKHPFHIAVGSFLHLACWLGGALVTWLCLILLGVSVTIFDAIAIEGIVCGIMSAGFLVPGSLGVQEGAYVALGLLFGVDANISLSLSLLRRGRDIVIGLPVLIVWQIFEAFTLRQRQQTTGSL